MQDSTLQALKQSPCLFEKTLKPRPFTGVSAEGGVRPGIHAGLAEENDRISARRPFTGVLDKPALAKSCDSDVSDSGWGTAGCWGIAGVAGGIA